jgi:uncharacterized damage-inducible protein DinB
MLESLNAHRDWANELFLEWIAARPEPDAYCLKMLTHVLTAEAVWLGRLRGESPAKPAEDPLAPAVLAALQRDNSPRWKEALADPARVVDYRTFAGAPVRSTVAEILTHVCMHGQYHRGQVAAQAARLGGKCPSTDYILFTRR